MKMWKIAEHSKGKYIAFKQSMMNYLHSKFNYNGWENDAEAAIYWFTKNWSSGKHSLLDDIYSISPYAPAVSSIENEIGRKQTMYKLLMDHSSDMLPYVLHSEWYIPKWHDEDPVEYAVFLDEALEIELDSAKLKAEAIEACQNRDHDMLKWEDDRTPDRIISTTKCKICDKYVQVNTKPAPNEIDIGGDALATNCKGLYETATPEEIEREIGKV